MTFANPFIVCADCARRVVDHPALSNEPCGHQADFNDLCPSWSPVDGCRCQAHLGYVPHPPAEKIPT